MASHQWHPSLIRDAQTPLDELILAGVDPAVAGVDPAVAGVDPAVAGVDPAIAGGQGRSGNRVIENGLVIGTLTLGALVAVVLGLIVRIVILILASFPSGPALPVLPLAVPV